MSFLTSLSFFLGERDLRDLRESLAKVHIHRLKSPSTRILVKVRYRRVCGDLSGGPVMMVLNVDSKCRGWDGSSWDTHDAS
jgi:hypothetical protein